MKNANKIKIFIRIDKFFLPVPPIPISFLNFLLRILKKFMGRDSKVILNNYEINRVINILKETKPFELVDIDAIDNGKRVIIKIITM